MIATPSFALRVALAVFAVLVISTACSERKQEHASETAAPSAAATEPGGQAKPTKSAEQANDGFDIGKLPVSDKPLGAFPYLGLPAGYAVNGNAVTNDFDSFPFWTGKQYQWVEGKIYAAGFGAAQDKSFSQMEVSRNVEALVSSLGGVKVASGQIPPEALEQLDAKGIGVRYSEGLGDVYNYPSETYVVHRADRDIWIHLCSHTAGGGWVVAETKPFQATAVVLPAAELQQQLDATGKATIHVNFASGRAEILHESQPQIAQVLSLLQGNPKLRLAVNGHTDSTGDRSGNKSLSQDRAQAVVAVLTAGGIAGERLRAAGFGQEQPIADNATEEGKARNRRVELIRL